MPGDRFLVVGARCRWRRDGPDRNAVLYDAAGQVVSEHVLGDGIAHVLATSTGQVWAGYFDEGIYGNYGWGQADTEEPVGAYGIVQFSPELEPAWHYPHYTAVGPWEPVNDCYALNVDDACTWACYDSDFPVVCIRDGTVTGWHNDITGARALAVAGSRVALFGGYGPDYDRLALTAARRGPRPACRRIPDRALRAGSRFHQALRSSAAEAACTSSPTPAGINSTWTKSQCEPGFWRRRVAG